MQQPAEIFVRFREQGWHCWPDAPERRIYLRNPHRHLFHVEVRTAVTHDERDIEFHDLRDDALGFFHQMVEAFEASSCETIARSLGELLLDKYKRAFTVVVSEDGECGATVLVQ